MIDQYKLSQLKQVIVEAGRSIQEFFGQELHRTYKSTSADFRTQADLAAEKIITDSIRRLFPEFNIIAEEEGFHYRISIKEC